jgi:hypothetical protein
MILKYLLIDRYFQDTGRIYSIREVVERAPDTIIRPAAEAPNAVVSSSICVLEEPHDSPRLQCKIDGHSSG